MALTNFRINDRVRVHYAPHRTEHSHPIIFTGSIVSVHAANQGIDVKRDDGKEGGGVHLSWRVRFDRDSSSFGEVTLLNPPMARWF